MNLISGFHMERVNLCFDAKRTVQVEAPQEYKYQCKTQGRIDP